MAWSDNFVENRVLDFDGFDVPEHTQGALTRYYLFGLPPGGFLTAMLSGDGSGAHLSWCVGLADPSNQLAIMEIRRWIEHYLPEHCYGTEKKVQDYIRSFMEARAKDNSV